MGLGTFDVAVVGAGPGGASAALHLARAGVRVVLLEKERMPRHKTCGGGLVYRTFGYLPPDVAAALQEGSLVERRCYRVAFNLLGRRTGFVVERAEPSISMVTRDAFDAALAGYAAAGGAVVMDGCPVASVAPGAGGVTVETARGRLTARFVVGADGATGATARRLGWGETRRLIPALEYEVYVDPPVLDRYGDTARFDFDLVGDGYAWVFPKADHLSIGVLSMVPGRKDLKARLADYLEMLGLGVLRRVVRHGYVIPVAPHAGAPARGRVLLVGDAAGLADPVTAEGISFAVWSGRLAAERLVAAGLDAARAADAYTDALSGRLLPELRTARRLARLVYGPAWLRHLVFGRYGEPLARAMSRICVGEGSYRRFVSAPSSYTRLLGLHPPPDGATPVAVVRQPL